MIQTCIEPKYPLLGKDLSEITDEDILEQMGYYDGLKFLIQQDSFDLVGEYARKMTIEELHLLECYNEGLRFLAAKKNLLALLGQEVIAESWPTHAAMFNGDFSAARAYALNLKNIAKKIDAQKLSQQYY
ncbi:hypothetical protein KAJ41_01440 [Candidatus Parcubacteria bacterium]|nr:hypothetical protein [Candidatus Parcubacteria bacterium]